MTHFLEIYSDKSIEKWTERLFDARFNQGMDYDQATEFLTKKYNITKDQLDGIRELVDINMEE